MKAETKAARIAKKLIEDFKAIMYCYGSGKYSEEVSINNAKNCATKTAKQMMASYKKGFENAGVDHDYKDNEHYEVLRALPKEIKKIKS